jgi:hypothetical protein
MQKSPLILASIMAVALAGACQPDDGNAESGEMCQIGGFHSCNCQHGVSGSQFCQPESLTWLDCKCPGTPANNPTVTIGNLEWEGQATSTDDWAAAGARCSSKSWRLPTVDDLKSLYSTCTIDSAAVVSCTCGDNDGCRQIPDGSFWSDASAECLLGTCYWAVQVTEGMFLPLLDSSPIQSVCVRAKP